MSYYGPLGPRGQAAQDRINSKVQRCMCESSLCDHGDRFNLHDCTRPADPRLMMSYVIHTCAQCAANMVTTGGSEYIHLMPRTPPPESSSCP